MRLYSQPSSQSESGRPVPAAIAMILLLHTQCTWRGVAGVRRLLRLCVPTQSYKESSPLTFASKTKTQSWFMAAGG
jgi:hypothetical protein